MRIHGLTKRYGATTAVDDLSLTMDRGRITAVLGPNGAGKTTTIETCEGYRRPDAGTVRVLGLDPITDTAALRPRVGVMLQAGGVYPSARVGETLRHAAQLYADPLDPVELADQLGLDPLRRTPYRRLSGGQQQRLSLALALVGRPELVFLDEPTAGLDPQARRDTWELVRRLRADGVTVVLATHHLAEAEYLADQVFILDRGTVIAAGSPAELTARHHTEAALTFTAPPGLPRAELAAVLPAGTTVSEPQAGRYLVAGDRPADARLLAAVAAWCADRDVLPEGLSVARRSLEDVFLDLTGRRPRP